MLADAENAHEYETPLPNRNERGTFPFSFSGHLMVAPGINCVCPLLRENASQGAPVVDQQELSHQAKPCRRMVHYSPLDSIEEMNATPTG